MKKVIKNNLLFAALFTVLFSFGNAKLSLKNNTRAKTSYVTFNNVKEGSVLSLKDTSNELLYKETITASGQYTKEFDFTFLPTGKYYFELEKDLEITTKTFSVNDDSITLNNIEETKFFIPTVTQKGPRLFISQLSLNKQPLKIKILYENGLGGFEVIHVRTIRDDLVLESIIKLSEKRKGTYKVILYSGNHRFEETFNL